MSEYRIEKDKAPTLQNWRVKANPYASPEMRDILVIGEVYGHHNPRFHDGKTITIGTVKASEGRYLRTKRTTYKLGRVEPEYRKYLKSEGIDYDAKHPFKVKL